MPVGALFRYGEGWSLFGVENGIARLQHVEIDHFTSSEVEIRSGLEEAAEVIMHPSKDVSEWRHVQVASRL